MVIKPNISIVTLAKDTRNGWMSDCGALGNSDIFNENIQTKNVSAFFFLKFGAKRRFFFGSFWFFLKNRAGEKNRFIFWLFDEKSSKIDLFFDFSMKNRKNRFIFWFCFEKHVFENRWFFLKTAKTLTISLVHVEGVSESGAHTIFHCYGASGI